MIFARFIVSIILTLLLSSCYRPLRTQRVEESPPRSNADIFFDDAQAFALLKKNAVSLKESFYRIKDDPKNLNELLKKEVHKEESLKGYGIMHLLAQGAASAPVIAIAKELVTVSNNPQSLLNKKAQGKSAFAILRHGLRPALEKKQDNLAFAHFFMSYDESLINDSSFSFDELNEVLLLDKHKTQKLFNALDREKQSQWQSSSSINKDEVQTILLSVPPAKDPSDSSDEKDNKDPSPPPIEPSGLSGKKDDEDPSLPPLNSPDPFDKKDVEEPFPPSIDPPGPLDKKDDENPKFFPSLVSDKDEDKEKAKTLEIKTPLSAKKIEQANRVSADKPTRNTNALGRRISQPMAKRLQQFEQKNNPPSVKTEKLPLKEKIVTTVIKADEIKPYKVVKEKNTLQFSDDEKEIDKKGRALKELFKGVLSKSVLTENVKTVESELAKMEKKCLCFLSSQQYFWTDVLNNVPKVFNKLDPDRIKWSSSGVAHESHSFKDEVHEILLRLVEKLEVKDGLIEKITALLPAALIMGSELESTLEKKLMAYEPSEKTNALLRQIRQLAKKRNNLFNEEQRTKAQEREGRLKIYIDMPDNKFGSILKTIFPSAKDTPEGNDFKEMSHTKNQFVQKLSKAKLESLFTHLLAKDHVLTTNHGAFLENLIRGLDNKKSYYAHMITLILSNLEQWNDYPTALEDLAGLSCMMAYVNGPLTASLKTYNDPKAADYKNRSGALVKRLNQWKELEKNLKNGALLTNLKNQEPEPLKRPLGGYGLRGSKKDENLYDENWLNQLTIKGLLDQSIAIDSLGQDTSKQVLADICRQIVFHPNQLENLKELFLSLIKRHSQAFELVNVIFELKNESEVANFAELIPQDLFNELIKYLNVANNVALSHRLLAERLTIQFFHYVSDEALKPLISTSKMWELMGSQSAALAMSLRPGVLKQITATLIENLAEQKTGEEFIKESEPNLARLVAKMEIYHQESAKFAAKKLLAIAEVMHEHKHLKVEKLGKIEKEISSKYSSLLRNLSKEEKSVVQRLKALLK